MGIAITGIGLVTPMGIGREAFWDACRSARSGLGRVAAFDVRPFRSNVAGLVEGFDPAKYMPAKTYRRMSRVSRMAVCASIEALGHSGLNLGDMERQRIAVVLGTGYGSSSHVEDFYVSLLRDGPRGAEPFFFPETVPNAAASHISMVHGLTGPNTTFCQNQISAENAILYAAGLLTRGQVDVALVGGADELSEIEYRCYDALGALNRVRVDGETAAVPHPGGGLVLGEGAGVLVMERLDHAVGRNARIYGLLRSAVITGGPARLGHYEADGKGLGRAVRRALEAAEVGPPEVRGIDVSSNYSGEIEEIESRVIREIFGPRGGGIEVSPLKYLLGDFGGAGAVRAAALALSLSTRRPLPRIDLEALRQGPHLWRTDPVAVGDISIMISATFGGGSAALVLSRMMT